MIHTATWDQIKKGLVTDVYFERAKEIFEAKGINAYVRVEFMAKALPLNWLWAVFAGAEECVERLAGLPVHLRMMKKRTIFSSYQPVMEVRGRYLEFGQYETTLLGVICQAFGIATMAVRCKKAAEPKKPHQIQCPTNASNHGPIYGTQCIHWWM